MTTSKKPVEKIRVGSVQASVWKNEGQSGPFYTVSIEHSYKDGDEWRTSNRFGLRDLVNLAKVALLAHSELLKLRFAEADEDAEAA